MKLVDRAGGKEKETQKQSSRKESLHIKSQVCVNMTKDKKES